jgi:hypothetical protein
LQTRTNVGIVFFIQYFEGLAEPMRCLSGIFVGQDPCRMYTRPDLSDIVCDDQLEQLLPIRPAIRRAMHAYEQTNFRLMRWLCEVSVYGSVHQCFVPIRPTYGLGLLGHGPQSLTPAKLVGGRSGGEACVGQRNRLGCFPVIGRLGPASALQSGQTDPGRMTSKEQTPPLFRYLAWIRRQSFVEGREMLMSIWVVSQDSVEHGSVLVTPGGICHLSEAGL